MNSSNPTITFRKIAGSYSSCYPTAQNGTYVKATTSLTGNDPYLGTDPTKSLTSTYIGNAWVSNAINTNQRVHIDLGVVKIINKIYYENFHNSGTSTFAGINNFTFWGSNSSSSFADLTYANDAGWTQLTTSQSTMDQHVGSDTADPKYITVTNSTEYRYYAFKIADNFSGDFIGFRRIELQTNITANYIVNSPQWGYSTIIDLPFEIEKLDSGDYCIWDHGSTFDIRKCKCTFLLPLAMANSLLTALTTDSLGRAATLTLILGSNSGFFPFGPDKGDSGDFTIRVLNFSPKSSIGHPADMFPIEVEFQNISTYPSYSLPTEIQEGDLQIGTIIGLRYPQGMHEQNFSFGIKPAITYGSDVYFIDSASNSDSHDSLMGMSLCQNKAAALINHLTGTVRYNSLSIIPPANSYLFGRLNSSTATYTCQWIDKQIEIQNPSFNNFVFNLNFHRVSQV